jgi:hypothetical protein
MDVGRNGSSERRGAGRVQDGVDGPRALIVANPLMLAWDRDIRDPTVLEQLRGLRGSSWTG